MNKSILLGLFLLLTATLHSQWTELGTGLTFTEYELAESIGFDALGTTVAAGNEYLNEARVFELVNDVWVQKGGVITETGDEISDYGESMVLNDDATIVAVGDHVAGIDNSQKGRVYAYEWDGNNWVPKGNPMEGLASGDQLSKSVVAMSADGLTIVAGARYNDTMGSNSGHVLVFQWDNDLGDWVQKGNPMNGTATNEAAGEFVSMSADGNTVSYSDLTSDAGFVYIYEWNATSEDWEQKGSTIVGDPGDVWTGASTSLSADGNTIAYGAPRYETYTGLIKVFEFNGTDWVQKGQTYFGEFEESWFGRNLELSADASHVVVNAWSYDFNAEGEEALNTGITVVLEYNGSTWEQKGETIFGTDVGARMGEKGVRISNDNSTIAFLDQIDGFKGPRVVRFLEPIGIDNAQENKAQIYPNPVAENLFIESKETGTLYIRSLEGKLIGSTKIEIGKNQLKTNELSSGVYQVTLVGSTFIASQVLVKE